ncbi:TetR/AcrR family transcriptional regulator [Phenylobacterium sp. LjRoot219]|uniref:TetR/AcrR family transcriptional regulator n=1 Tax=Phenylobacterium sp. LjRoot219 TaxID=3342283 RepID=UPI003ECD13FE
MKLERKNGEENSRTREALLDATETIMVEEGYGAVTSRRVEERAGLKSQLVHYHFGTMDELFVAVYERSEREFFRRHVQALKSGNPLRALWELSIHPKRTRLAQELIALSNHKKPIRKITARLLEQMHAINEVFIERYLEEAGVDRERYPPVVVSHIINGLSRSLVTEEALGVSSGRAEVLAFAERMLSEIEAQHRLAQSTPPAA